MLGNKNKCLRAHDSGGLRGLMPINTDDLVDEQTRVAITVDLNLARPV